MKGNRKEVKEKAEIYKRWAVIECGICTAKDISERDKRVAHMSETFDFVAEKGEMLEVVPKK